MITLIYGDDKKGIYRKFAEIFPIGTARLEIDLKKNTLEEAQDTLSTDTLFSAKRAIVITSIKKLHHTKRKKLLEKIQQFQKDPDTHIFILEESVLDKKTLTKIPYDRIFTFQLPKYFFDFLDSLAPKNADHVSSLINKLSGNTEGEQMFYAAVNRVRTLLLFKTGNAQEFQDVKRTAPFFRSKLESQSGKWREDDLIKFYRALFDIEVGLKTSNLPMSIAQHLDITIRKHLQ